MSVAIVVALFAVWSSVFSVGKIALQYCPPLFLTGSRMVLAGVLLYLFMAAFKRTAFQSDPSPATFACRVSGLF